MNKIIIYGIGTLGKEILDFLEKLDYKIICIIDEFIQEITYNNHKIFRIKEVPNAFKNIPVYLTSNVPITNYIIENNLKKAGFSIILKFNEVLAQELGLIKSLMNLKTMWLDPNQADLVESNLDNIKQLNMLLSDNQSIKLLEQIIKFRTTLEPKYYVIPDNQIQYFPMEIDFLKHIDNLKFIDCGAFIGDTIPLIMKNHNNISLIVSLNIISLTNEINKQKNLHPDTNFLVYSCGVWDKTEILQFSADGGSASSINNVGSKNTISISVTSLDESVYGCSPNYIKMDIEGAEQEAIKGAKNIIKNFSPILAICLYHKPADLWEIPLLINSINPNYDMYIRVYGHMLFETVLYCVPKGFKCENIN